MELWGGGNRSHLGKYHRDCVPQAISPCRFGGGARGELEKFSGLTLVRYLYGILYNTHTSDSQKKN